VSTTAARSRAIPFPSDAHPRPSLASLEARFIEGELAPLPSGLVVGRFLGFVSSRGAARPIVRALDTICFRAVRWGLDLDRQRWWFEHARLATAHFRIEEGPSRWRPTRVLRLHYDVSRLPIRGVLYDELKPLPDGRILGLGGVNAERGEGDHFFFDLAPLPVRDA
jgi:hypothetical protein